MRIGFTGSDGWLRAFEQVADEVVRLPAPVASNRDDQRSSAAWGEYSMEARVASGEAALAMLAGRPVDLLIDEDGLGLGFVRGAGGMTELSLLHEKVGVPLLSMCRQPLPRVMAGLPWDAVWRIAQSTTWRLLFHDRRHVEELTALGLPEVGWMPALPAEPLEDPSETDHPSVAPPRDAESVKPVLFVGHAGPSQVFTVPPASAMESWVGLVTATIGGYPGGPSFHDLFYRMYNCAVPPAAGATIEDCAGHAAVYMRSRQRYLGELALRARDRFIIFLHGKLQHQLRIYGDNWTGFYGVPSERMPGARDARQALYRSGVINIGLVHPNTDGHLDPHLLEVAAAGGFLLMYRTEDLETYFTPGMECDVFDEESSLLDRVAYYLERPSERKAIAEAGRQRVLRDHQGPARARAIIEMAGSIGVRDTQTAARDDVERVCHQIDATLRLMSKGQDAASKAH